MSASVLPMGKGLWLRDPDAIDGVEGRRDVPALVRRLVGASFSWVSPVALWGGGNVREDLELHAALGLAGIDVWPLWGLPRPDSWREEIGPFFDHASNVGAVGVIVDPEREWLDEHDEARAFAAALREEADARGLVLAITSYSVPDGHPRFPWEAFAEVADLGIPQTYDRDLLFDPAYPARAVRQWRARGFRDVIAAGSLWAHKGRRPKTPAEFLRHVSQLPRQRATIFWGPQRIPAPLWRALAGAGPAAPGGFALGALAAGLALVGAASKLLRK